MKILQLFINWVGDHRFKLEQKIGTESSCAGSVLSDTMLIFLSGNRSVVKFTYICQEESYMSNGILVKPKLLQSMSFFASSLGQSFQLGSLSECTKLGLANNLKHTRTKENLRHIWKKELVMLV